MNESPFAAAREQGIQIDYYERIGKNVVALYADLNGYQIVLNPLMDNDSLEDAVHALLLHHNSDLRGVPKVIHRDDFRPLANSLQKGLEKLNRTILNLSTLVLRLNT